MHKDKLIRDDESDLQLAKKKYLDAVAKIPDYKKTADGLNLKQLMTNIGDYVGSSNMTLKIKHYTYEKLTEMVENPSKAAHIANKEININQLTNSENDSLKLFLQIVSITMMCLGAACVIAGFPLGLAVSPLAYLLILGGLLLSGASAPITNYAAKDDTYQERLNDEKNKTIKRSFESAFRFFGDQKNNASPADYSINGDKNDLAYQLSDINQL